MIFSFNLFLMKLWLVPSGLKVFKYHCIIFFIYYLLFIICSFVTYVVPLCYLDFLKTFIIQFSFNHNCSVIRMSVTNSNLMYSNSKKTISVTVLLMYWFFWFVSRKKKRKVIYITFRFTQFSHLTLFEPG